MSYWLLMCQLYDSRWALVCHSSTANDKDWPQWVDTWLSQPTCQQPMTKTGFSGWTPDCHSPPVNSQWQRLASVGGHLTVTAHLSTANDKDWPQWVDTCLSQPTCHQPTYSVHVHIA